MHITIHTCRYILFTRSDWFGTRVQLFELFSISVHAGASENSFICWIFSNCDRSTVSKLCAVRKCTVSKYTVCKCIASKCTTSKLTVLKTHCVNMHKYKRSVSICVCWNQQCQNAHVKSAKVKMHSKHFAWSVILHLHITYYILIDLVAIAPYCSLRFTPHINVITWVRLTTESFHYA